MTEMISSVDLIEEQIRVAMGEKLRYKQVTENNQFFFELDFFFWKETDKENYNNFSEKLCFDLYYIKMRVKKSVMLKVSCMDVMRCIKVIL